MIRLTDIEKEIVKELLLLVKESKTYITYKDLCDKIYTRINVQLNPHTELPKRLGAIGKLCNELNLPMLNAIVVNQTMKRPGEGFMNLLKQLGRDVEKKSSNELFEEEKKNIREYPNWQYLADYLQIDIEMSARGEIIFPYDIMEKESFEGAKKRVEINSYERNAYERNRCIDYYSKNGRIGCQICGFDFGKFYGEQYKNLIEVHHIKPISEIEKNYKIDGTKDLIPICPNCHMVVHSKNAESIADLKKRLRKP